MFCQNCKTPFQVVPIPEGKQKFCKKCGNFIYKKENNSIIIFHVDDVTYETTDEVELRESINREKELRNKEQLERKQKEEEFRLRLREERLLKEKEEQSIKEEQEKLLQIQLEEQYRIQKEKDEKEKLLQLEAEIENKIRLEKSEQKRLLQIEKEEQKRILQKEKEEQKRTQLEKLEQEKNLQKELEKQRNILKQKEEQEKLLQLQLEKQKELREKLLLEQLEREKEEIQRIEKILLEREEKIRLENERIENENIKLAAANKERIEREQKFKLEKDKETARIKLHNEQKPNRTILVQPNKNNWKKYAMPLLAGVFITLTLIFLKNKISSFSKSTKTVLASADSNTSPIDLTYNLDTALLEQLKTNLIGKEILSWKIIKKEDLKNLTILNGTKSQDNTLYNVAVNLEDRSKTKAVAELAIYYNKIILENIETNKITYSNVAPANAWFSFAPIANCTISVNTNNNPIQLKFCKDCSISKMVSTKEAPQEIESTSTIFIRSDNKYNSIVEFSYAPIKLNQ